MTATQKQVAEAAAAKFAEATKQHLHIAIRTMREACDDAERAVNRPEAPYHKLDDKPRQTLTKLAWGFANASSHLETAMGYLSDHHEMRREALGGDD